MTLLSSGYRVFANSLPMMFPENGMEKVITNIVDKLVKQSEVNIEDRVKKVILDRVKRSLNPADIVRETPLIGKGLGLDSVGIFELVISLEEEFNIVFDESELSIEIFENIGSLVNHISKKL
jgi:acyl carrier protein